MALRPIGDRCFAPTLAADGARREVNAGRWSFAVVDLHHHRQASAAGAFSRQTAGSHLATARPRSGPQHEAVAGGQVAVTAISDSAYLDVKTNKCGDPTVV